MRRVLFLTLGYEPGRVGGAERQARLQGEELVRRGWGVDVVTFRDPGTRSDVIGGVRVIRLSRSNRRFLRTITYLPVLLLWLLRNVHRYQIVHVHLANWQADAAGIACRFTGVPLYVKLAAGGPRGEIGRMRRVSWITRFAGIRRARFAQATSAEIERDLRGLGIPEERILRIPNGLPRGVFEPADSAERAQLREELDLPKDEVIVVHAGRFARYKGVLDLIEAWQHLSGRSAATLVMVGQASADDPVEVPPTRKLVLRHWTADVASYLRAADVYAHPAWADGMPNVVLEAMSCGLAVVATRQAALPEMITDGTSGLLVGVAAPDEMGRALERLIEDRELRRRLGSEAAARAHRDYSIEHVVDRIEGAYRSMLASETVG